MEHENDKNLAEEDTMPAIRKGREVVILLLTAAIIAGGMFGLKYLEENKVEAKKVEIPPFLPTVDTAIVDRVDFVPNIELQGEVMPATETELISEVSGAITEVSPKLEIGSVIEKDEIIVRVNDADYRTQLANAKSSLADAELTLVQERARAVQSIRDWNKLGSGKPASELVQRIPQIKSAEARIEAAKAAIAKAKRDVEKTVIRAPYRCIVDQKFIDKGAFLSAMSRIAKVYSVSKFEVRLPVSLDTVSFLPADNGVGSTVALQTKVGAKKLQWTGKVDRFEGGIDSKTFSMMMVVSVDPSHKQGLFKFPPKGLFIDANLKGKELPGVIKVPRVAIRENDQIWLLDEEKKLRIKPVEIVREEKDYIYVKSDLKEGEKVIISPIATPVEGMPLEEQKQMRENKTADKQING